MSYAVVACSRCREPWAVEARHATAACPRCQRTVELAHRTRLWEGPDAREAQRQAAHHRAQAAGKSVPPVASRYTPRPPPTPHHDSPAAEAAASARGIANKSARAEMVAAILSRTGPASHADLLEALQMAGLDTERAEAEVIRMLGMDILMEPKAGHYRILPR